MNRATWVITTLMLLSALLAAPAADAQSAGPSQPQLPPQPQPLTADEMQKRAALVAGTLAPLVTKTTEESFDAQLRIAERPETAERIATFKRNLFDALRRKGFTAEQALQLTSATSMPPFGSR